MLKRISEGLKEANAKARSDTGAQFLNAIATLFVALAQAILCVLHMVLRISDRLARSVEKMFVRQNEAFENRRATKLRSHIDWNAEPRRDGRVSVLRR